MQVRNWCLVVGLGVLLVAGAWATESPKSGAKPTPAAAKVVTDKVLYSTDDRTIVKKSNKGLCHDRKSGSFNNTTHYKAYLTMQDCLDSGGKRAK